MKAEDGFYAIAATYDDTKEIWVSIEEAYPYTDPAITFIHKEGTLETRPYALGKAGDALVIGQPADEARVRVRT